MRIIAGDFKRRRLQGPADASVTRPIPDLVKQSLFNILRGHCADGAVFDCFAGTGSIGLEALSRGATRCVFVERDRKIAEVLRANIETCGAGDRAEVVVGDVLGAGALSRCPRPVHLVFFDPPYPMVRDKASWLRVREQFAKAVQLLDETGYAVLRTPWPCFHAAAEEAPDEGSYAAHGRREHMRKRGEDADGRGGRWRGGDEAERPGGAGKRGRGAGSGARRTPVAPVGLVGLDGEDVEIDLDSAEGMALLEELEAAGFVVARDGVGEGGGDGAEPDARASGSEAGAGDAAAKPAHEMTDLVIPGAIGPETHAYSGMAVHLYMRERA